MISAPEDYGLDAEQTLAHTTDAEPPDDFDDFWGEVREAVETLPVHWVGSLDDATNEVVIPSLRSVRVVARVSMPSGTPAGVVVTTHGYQASDAFPDGAEPWTARGLATVRLRVRGFPPSTLDIDDLRADWILHCIESPQAWIVRGAVADVMQAVRCARTALGGNVPISLHGESLGGGLAIIAAAQLAALGAPVYRMAIGLPSLGDWPWRAGRYCNGAGGEINRLLDVYRDDLRENLMHSLSLFDAALHARCVHCPVLCKLARQDDTVPAPAAAAVCNALASHEVWRFETSYGHYDGGLADLRRHALFERLHPAFLDPRVTPESAIAAAGIALNL